MKQSLLAKISPSMMFGGAVNPVCVWNIDSPKCGMISRVSRSSLMQGQLCRLAVERHTLGNISLKVWRTGRNSIVEVLLVGGLALETGQSLLS